MVIDGDLRSQITNVVRVVSAIRQDERGINVSRSTISNRQKRFRLIQGSSRPPAPGQAAEGRRAPGVSAPPHPRDPGPLAAGGDPPSHRQPLRLPGRHGRCETNSLNNVFGLAPNTAARFKAAPTGGKVRRFKEFFDAAGSWSRVRRIVARVEAGSEGTDARFIVTNSATAADVPFLHAGAYWPLRTLRTLMRKHSSWRVAQFDTLPATPDQDRRPQPPQTGA